VDNLYKIPASWQLTTLEEIADMTSGGTPSRTKKDYWNGSINWLKSGELKDTYIYEIEEKITEDGLKNSSAKIFPKNTLLMAMYGATVGRLGILNVDSSTNQAVCAIFNHHNLFENEYLFFYLLSMRQKMLKDSFGGAQPNLSQGYIKSIEIPFAPLNEQKRIVAKIEKLFSNLDNSDKYLLHLEKQLKRYRQSVLKSAFEGELTKEWRKKQINLETVDELLEKIKTERIEYAEQEIRSKFKDKTEEWIKDKVKVEVEKFYSELKPIEEYEKPFDIPSQWDWHLIKESTMKIHYGYTATSDKNINGIGYLRITDIQNNKVNWDEVPNCIISEEDVHKYELKNDDIVFARTGATVGKSFLIKDIPCRSVFASYLIRLILANQMYSNYVYKFFQSPIYWNQIRKNESGIGQPNVNAEKLSNLIFPLCSAREQKEIVNQIEKHFSIIDRLETVVQKSIAESKRLRQSILKQAFEGKLIEQDPNDERATVLLEKIAQAKEGYQKTIKRKKYA